MSHLLYLEDDEALAFVTQRALTRKGFTVTHYTTVEAVELAFQDNSHDQLWQYALLDLKLGNNSSLELIKQIKQHLNIPIVLLTGYGSITTAVQAMKSGAINYLSKPCSINDIIAALYDRNATTEISKEIEKPSLKCQEWEAIQQSLKDNDGNVSATAKQLKMHRRTLQRKLQKRVIKE